MFYQLLEFQVQLAVVSVYVSCNWLVPREQKLAEGTVHTRQPWHMPQWGVLCQSFQFLCIRSPLDLKEKTRKLHSLSTASLLITVNYLITTEDNNKKKQLMFAFYI